MLHLASDAGAASSGYYFPVFAGSIAVECGQKCFTSPSKGGAASKKWKSAYQSHRELAGAWAYYNLNRAIYEAFSVLFDWLNTLFTLLPKVGRTAMAARARKTSNRAYSTRSCPSSSRMNFLSS